MTEAAMNFVQQVRKNGEGATICMAPDVKRRIMDEHRVAEYEAERMELKVGRLTIRTDNRIPPGMMYAYRERA